VNEVVLPFGADNRRSSSRSILRSAMLRLGLVANSRLESKSRAKLRIDEKGNEGGERNVGDLEQDERD